MGARAHEEDGCLPRQVGCLGETLLHEALMNIALQLLQLVGGMAERAKPAAIVAVEDEGGESDDDGVCVVGCGLCWSCQPTKVHSFSDAPDMDTIAEQERRYAIWAGRAQMVAAKALAFLLPPEGTAALRPTWARRCAVGQLRVCLPRLKDCMVDALGDKSQDLYALLMVCSVRGHRQHKGRSSMPPPSCSGSACGDAKCGILTAAVTPGKVGPAARCVRWPRGGRVGLHHGPSPCTGEDDVDVEVEAVIPAALLTVVLTGAPGGCVAGSGGGEQRLWVENITPVVRPGTTRSTLRSALRGGTGYTATCSRGCCCCSTSTDHPWRPERSWPRSWARSSASTGCCRWCSGW